MGKYIVELKKNETLYKATTRESDGTAYVCSAIGTPYVNPDLEQVREEAYEEGKKQAKVQAELDVCHDIEKVAKENYKAGLSDAWEAVRKIYDISQEDRLEIFPEASTFVVADICDRYFASECVEKIRQYEQEKDRQARIEYNFDEIKDVLETTAKECNVSLDEIAEVLRKMGETNNG